MGLAAGEGLGGLGWQVFPAAALHGMSAGHVPAGVVPQMVATPQVSTPPATPHWFSRTQAGTKDSGAMGAAVHVTGQVLFMSTAVMGWPPTMLIQVVAPRSICANCTACHTQRPEKSMDTVRTLQSVGELMTS